MAALWDDAASPARFENWIDNKRCPAANGDWIESTDPSRGEVWALGDHRESRGAPIRYPIQTAAAIRVLRIITVRGLVQTAAEQAVRQRLLDSNSYQISTWRRLSAVEWKVHDPMARSAAALRSGTLPPTGDQH